MTAEVSDGPRGPLPRVLNLGCGRHQLAGALNVDISSSVEPDLVVDLSRSPWPLPSDWFEVVHAYDVVEHVDDVVAFFEEVHRVSAPGGIVHVTVPHFSCANAFTDPTHRHYFGLQSFDYLTGEHRHNHYTSVRFQKEAVEAIFAKSLLNKLTWRVVKRFPEAWESRWAWIFPAWFISARLRVTKGDSQ
jgi:predicted SAM-dependent methyltransferase